MKVITDSWLSADESSPGLYLHLSLSGDIGHENFKSLFLVMKGNKDIFFVDLAWRQCQFSSAGAVADCE